MVSGWEIVFYAALGLVTGLLAYVFIRLMHGVEDFFHGKKPGRLSAFLGRQPLPLRAALGGLLVGCLALVHPVVWGTGHEYINEAAVRALPLALLASGCVLKLVATALTLGSGGSGGTFFPTTVMGALAGGAFGEVLHAAMPGITAPSGAYAMVGMGGAVAALTRGPLTGLMMVYELSGNYAIILPLMVTCTHGLGAVPHAGGTAGGRGAAHAAAHASADAGGVDGAGGAGVAGLGVARAAAHRAGGGIAGARARTGSCWAW